MAIRGTNQGQGKPFNRRIVLESIRLHGPIARGDIADRVGLTVQTVSTIARELEEDGYVLSVRQPPKGKGVPPSTLAINPEGGFAIGIQLTPLGIEAGLINLAGDVVARRGCRLDHATPGQAFHEIESLVAALKSLDPARRLLGLGLAMPGPFGVETMSFIGPTTMAGWQEIDIVARLEEATGLPAFIEADMAAAALGEQLYGYGTELREYYYLFLGIGLGGTMVHEGAIVRGNWGNAGELGHVTSVPDGEPCPCGNQGCLERYLSLDALSRSRLGEAEWVDSVRPHFARAVRMIENLFDPQTIVLGGFASRDLLERLAATADRIGNSIAARRDRTFPRIVVERGGESSVLRGAAALAVRGAISPRDGLMFTGETPARQMEGIVP